MTSSCLMIIDDLEAANNSRATMQTCYTQHILLWVATLFPQLIIIVYIYKMTLYFVGVKRTYIYSQSNYSNAMCGV